MNWIIDFAVKTRTSLMVAAVATKRAARWSRMALGALAGFLVALALADRFADEVLLRVSVVLSACAVVINTIAAASHCSAFFASRRAVKASRTYAEARIHPRTFIGMFLAWIAQLMAMSAVPLAGLACAMPILWIPVMAAFAGCVAIAQFVGATQRMIALVEDDTISEGCPIEV